MAGLRRHAPQPDHDGAQGVPPEPYDECMDVVQAVVSLLDAEGFTQEDVDAAIERCNERNRERGRL